MKFTDSPAEPLAVRPAPATGAMTFVACLSREAMTALYLIVWIAAVGASVVAG